MADSVQSGAALDRSRIRNLLLITHQSIIETKCGEIMRERPPANCVVFVRRMESIRVVILFFSMCHDSTERSTSSGDAHQPTQQTLIFCPPSNHSCKGRLMSFSLSSPSPFKLNPASPEKSSAAAGHPPKFPQVKQRPKNMSSVIEIQQTDDENEAIVGYSWRTEKMHSYISKHLEEQERSKISYQGMCDDLWCYRYINIEGALPRTLCIYYYIVMSGEGPSDHGNGGGRGRGGSKWPWQRRGKGREGGTTHKSQSHIHYFNGCP